MVAVALSQVKDSVVVLSGMQLMRRRGSGCCSLSSGRRWVSMKVRINRRRSASVGTV